MKPINLILSFTLEEYAAITETAALSNVLPGFWAKNYLLNATITNEEDRFKLRRDILEKLVPQEP